MIKSNGAASTYGYRPLLNSEALIEWGKAAGLGTMLQPDDMHVTIVYSESPIDRNAVVFSTGYDIVVARGAERHLKMFGPEQTVLVLCFFCPEVYNEWTAYRRAGASWDNPGYTPHVTLTYDVPAGIDVANLPPFDGDLTFGPLVLEDMDPEAKNKVVEKNNPLLSATGHAMITPMDEDLTKTSSTVRFVKVDEEQRIVWGWSSVSTVKGEPHYDVHGDYIPIDVLTKGATKFMEDYRVGKAMHYGSKVSTIVHSLPLSMELAKALGIECETEGWITGFKVHSDEVWELVKSGVFPAFSIGGRIRRTKVTKNA